MRPLRAWGSSIILGTFAMTSSCDGEDMTVGNANPDVQAGDVWSGYVEGWTLPSGSDQLALTFTTLTSGTLRLGATPVDEPPLDMNIPPRVENDKLGHPGSSPGGQRDYERFDFTMESATLDQGRLRFKINLDEPWAKWCAGQTPLTNIDGSFGCTASSSIILEGDVCLMAPGVEIDCRKAMACENSCQCNHQKCEHRREHYLHFDMRMNGAKIDGSAVGTMPGKNLLGQGGGPTSVNVRLDQQPRNRR